jgi:hypothetical protein
MHWPLHVSVWVQTELLPQTLGPPSMQGTEGPGFGIAMHCPPQGETEGHAAVGVQVELVGQSLETPSVQGITGGGGGGVCIHWPGQLPPVGQNVVGVHVEPVGQPVVLPMAVQGKTGGGVNIDRQSPPQVIVCVQAEPEGHTLNPPTIQGVGELVSILLVIVLWCL